jgi:hypothetical protein
MAEERTPTGMFHFAHVHGFTYETLYMMAAKADFEWVPHKAKRAAQTFKRIEQSDPNWFRFPDHARELQEHFRKRGLVRHLFRADPYRRAWLRLTRKIRERGLSGTRA